MKKLLVSASALAALAVTATPAHAVPAVSDASASVNILRPLVLTSEGDLNLQTIVLTGGTYSATVGVSQSGAADCDGGSGNVTCSGTMTAAAYRLVGTNDQDVTISVDDVDMTNPAGDTLTLAVDAPAEVNLGAEGNSTGMAFNIGGSVTVDQNTPDGLYEGVFAVTAEYK